MDSTEAPLVAGGQGRSGEEITRTALWWLIIAVGWIAALSVLALLYS